MALLYYKGETSNPYEEITETQGAHCQHYNAVASMLWDFEYHWANGWDKYKNLAVRNRALYFEQHPQPQKEFDNIEDALMAFAHDNYSKILYLGSERWINYVYTHAMEERFYKPIFNVVPADEIPNYLQWYKGEEQNPYQYEPNTSTKGFWWNFEMNWYKTAETLSQQAFEEYLHSWITNRVLTGSNANDKNLLAKHIAAYKAGVTG